MDEFQSMIVVRVILVMIFKKWLLNKSFWLGPTFFPVQLDKYVSSYKLYTISRKLCFWPGIAISTIWSCQLGISLVDSLIFCHSLPRFLLKTRVNAMTMLLRPEPKSVKFIIYQPDCRITYLWFKNSIVFNSNWCATYYRKLIQSLKLGLLVTVSLRLMELRLQKLKVKEK